MEREAPGSLLRELVAGLKTLSGAEEYGDWRVQTLFGGVLGSVYSLLQFLFSPFWGGLSDRIGRRPVLLITIAGLAASYALWIFSGTFLLFVVSRILGGMMSGNIAAATAAVADSTTREERAKGMGIIGAAFGLGFVLGPALGGSLSLVDLGGSEIGLDVLGVNPFSAAGLGAFCLSAVNLVWVARRFRETRPRGSTPGAPRPLNPATLLLRAENPAIGRTQLAYFVFLVAFSGMEFTLTFLVRERFQWREIGNTILFVYVGLLVAFVQAGVVRRLAPRIGEKRTARAGLLLVAPGLAITALTGDRVVFYAGITALGIGSALAIPTLTALVSLLAPADRQGHVLGIFRSLGALARAVGPFLAALAFWRLGSAAPYLAGAAAVCLSIFLVRGVPQPARHEAPSAASKPHD